VHLIGFIMRMVTMYVFAKIRHDLNEGLSRPLSEIARISKRKFKQGIEPRTFQTQQNVTAWAQFIIQNIFHYVTNIPISKLIIRLMAIN